MPEVPVVDDSFDPLVPRPLDLPRAVPLQDDADLGELDTGKILAAPSDPADWPAWRAQLERWRREARDRQGYDGRMYERDDLRWASSCFVVSQVWLWDELLYDWERGVFTPERLVADARERFGGFDGVVLWHSYPVIGIDDRNQWDYYRLVPGLRDLVDALHAEGVRVFVDYNPWDVGTRRGDADSRELASLVADLDIDGVFLDTLKEGGGALLAELDAARAGVAAEGESTLPLARLADHPLSWAQWFADSEVPGVVRSHWYERRHQMHHVRRWHRSHADELQSAWLNGIGVMVWEVVFGVWVGWSDRDALTLRRMSAAQRGLAGLTRDGEWTPLADLGEGAPAQGLFGSRFAAGGQSLYAVANRSAVEGTVSVDAAGANAAFDVWSGYPLDVVGGRVTARVPGHGIGGVWLAPAGADAGWLRPLRAEGRDISARFRPRLARRLAGAAADANATTAADRPPTAYVVVEAGEHVLTVRYRCRETGFYDGAPFVDEWKPLPPRLHDLRTAERVANVPSPVAVATAEVSEREFAKFLKATGHEAPVGELQPRWAGADWVPGEAPVTEVTLADARAYAAWCRGRLPTEDEWQIASATEIFARRQPEVWNLTDSEHSDGRSRFMMLKGGSAHRADGSPWYFDGGVRPGDFTAKYLLPGLGLSRSDSIGFRVAWDLPVEAGSS